MTTTSKSNGAKSAAVFCAAAVGVVFFAAGCGTLRSKPWDSPIKTVEWSVTWPTTAGASSNLDEELRKVVGVFDVKMIVIKAGVYVGKKYRPGDYKLIVKYDSRKISITELRHAIEFLYASIQDEGYGGLGKSERRR